MNLLYIIVFLLVFPVGCAWHGGGGDYRYSHYNPVTSELTETCVHSVREFDSALVLFNPDGTALIHVQGVKPGPDNLGKALDIIGAGLAPKIMP
jgi:hypothetical protein